MEGSAVETQTPPIDPTEGQAVGGDIADLLEQIGLGEMKIANIQAIMDAAEQNDSLPFAEWMDSNYGTSATNSLRVWKFLRE